MSETLKQGQENDLNTNSVIVERQITLRGEEITLYLNKLPMGEGHYDVAGLGNLDISLSTRSKDNAHQIILNCIACPELQGSKGKKERTIEIANGYGSQMIAPDKLLRIDTGNHQKQKTHREETRQSRRRRLDDNRGLGGPWMGIRQQTLEEKIASRLK